MFMTANRNTVLKQLEIIKLKETVGKQQAEIIQLHAENERLKVADDERARHMVQLQAADDERARQLLQMRAVKNTRGIELNRVKEQSIAVNWYDTRTTTLVDGFKSIKDAFEISRKRVNIMWNDRCKAQEVQRKRDHDNDDQGNPDASASSEPQGAFASTQTIVYQPQQTETVQGMSGGSKDDVVQLESGITLQECPPESSMTGANVASSSANVELFISDMSDEQILRLTDMKVVDDTTINETPSEPNVTNLDGLDEIVFEGDVEKSKYVREDGTEFNLLDEDWLKDNVDEIDERLKNRDSSDVPADSFEEWRKNFLSKTAKPAHPVAQVDYMKYEKNRSLGRILSWIFVKELHCVAVKREQKFQLDPTTNTARYRLMYKPVKVLDRIPLMSVEQDILENIALWCYDSDTHEAVIVFRSDKESLCILDPM
ncbi:hypothetical protein Hanom_Chr04g00317691 [Helianthus anomalus]